MIARRFAALLVLMYWQGGFLFYGTVVVTVGAAVLGSDREQGFITRHVAWWLNATGGVALLALAVERACDTPSESRRLWLLWALMAALVAFRAWLHPRLDAHLDPEDHNLSDRPGFRTLHRWYLRVWTLLWACAMAYTVGLLRRWRTIDAGDARPPRDHRAV